MFSSYLTTPCTIINEEERISAGIARSVEINRADEWCKKESPSHKDLTHIHHMIRQEHQIRLLYLDKNTIARDTSIVVINDQRYVIIAFDPIQGRKGVHHIECYVRRE